MVIFLIDEVNLKLIQIKVQGPTLLPTWLCWVLLSLPSTYLILLSSLAHPFKKLSCQLQISYAGLLSVFGQYWEQLSIFAKYFTFKYLHIFCFWSCVLWILGQAENSASYLSVSAFCTWKNVLLVVFYIHFVVVHFKGSKANGHLTSGTMRWFRLLKEVHANLPIMLL